MLSNLKLLICTTLFRWILPVSTFVQVRYAAQASHSSAGVGEEAGRYILPLFPTVSQPIWCKKPTKTRARNDREIDLFLPIWLLSALAATEISAHSKEDVGWKSNRGTQSAWAPSPKKQSDKCFPQGDTHKLQNTSPTGCSSPVGRPPAWGILIPKYQLGLVLSFLDICQGDPSFSAPSATNQTTGNSTWWGGTLTTSHREANAVIWQEQYCIMNVGVWITKQQCSTLMWVFKKKKKASSRGHSEQQLN